MARNATASQAKLVVGLGNPGARYAMTRHNIGFRVLDHVALQWGVSWKGSFRFHGDWCRHERDGCDVILLKPHTLMNLSGKSVHSVVRYFGIAPERVLCVCDDITLPFGGAKLSMGRGDAGHNGVRDMIERIGNAFSRLRIGIGSRSHPEQDLKDHVLSRFPDEEEQVIRDRMPYYAECIQWVISRGPELAMNQINQRH